MEISARAQDRAALLGHRHHGRGPLRVSPHRRREAPVRERPGRGGPGGDRGGHRGFFTTIGGLRHRVLEKWEADGTTIVEAEVTYTRQDGDQVSLPAAIILRRTGPDGEKVSDYRIFVDQGPLYA